MTESANSIGIDLNFSCDRPEPGDSAFDISDECGKCWHDAQAVVQVMQT